MIGVILNSLESSQLAYFAIKQGNSIVENGCDFVIFQENSFPACLKPNFAIMNTAEMWKFRGHLISTNLSHAAQLIKVKNHLKKYFYVHDLEFLRTKRNFVENVKIYRNDELKLIAPSQEYADILENYCNRKPIVVEDFDIVKIIKSD
jgi:hypothetical protein